uniref:Uncharacterized protein n=1 Tax=Cannabis sativa TaxID=3483 RepID=A0A803PD08_CANSA
MIKILSEGFFESGFNKLSEEGFLNFRGIARALIRLESGEHRFLSSSNLDNFGVIIPFIRAARLPNSILLTPWMMVEDPFIDSLELEPFQILAESPRGQLADGQSLLPTQKDHYGGSSVTKVIGFSDSLRHVGSLLFPFNLLALNVLQFSWNQFGTAHVDCQENIEVVVVGQPQFG